MESNAGAAKDKETDDAKKGGNFSRTTNCKKTILYGKSDGKCDNLKGHICKCSDAKKQAGVFVKTAKESTVYIGVTNKNGLFVADLFDDQPEASSLKFANVGKNEEGVEEMQTMQQIRRDGRFPRSWVLLDNQSSADLSCNKDVISTNIRGNFTSTDIKCNIDGVTRTNLSGTLRGYGILSLARVKKRGYHTTFDSTEKNAFHLHKDGGMVYICNQFEKGLYYLEIGRAHV